MIPKKSTLNRELLLTGLIFISYILVFWGSKLYHINDFFFCGQGDGLKTYYNIAYHVKYGNGLMNFDGMTYPYGEHLYLEDSMPLFSNTLFLLAQLFPSISNYTVGIINLLYFILLGISIFLLHLILKHFKINGFASSIASNGIILLSSQNLLLFPAGQISLTFTCFFPMGWFFLIQFIKSEKKLKWSLLWALSTSLWSFVHIYLGLISLMFGAIVLLLYELMGKNKPDSFSQRVVYYLIKFGLPILVIFLFFKIFDRHPNRIDMPFIDFYRSTLSSAFAPNISPIKPILVKIFDFSDDTNYSWTKIGSYPGILSIFTMLLIICEMVIITIKRKFSRFFELTTRIGIIFLLGSTIMLLFSFGIPLRFIPDQYLNHIPIIKQFSALGRFSWAFYYVITVMTLVYWQNRIKSILTKRVVIIFISLTFLLESMPIHYNLSKKSFLQYNAFNSNLLKESERTFVLENPEQYQAIIPLPTFFKYNLPFSKFDTDSSVYAAMVTSVHTGLPIFSTYLSRPSVTESMDIYITLQRFPYKKIIPRIIEDGRPFAVVFYQPDTAVFNVNEKELIKHCVPKQVSHTYSLFSLPISKLQNQPIPVTNFDFLITQNDTTIVEPSESFVYTESFDSLPSKVVYYGNGAFQGVKNSWNNLFRISTNKMDTATNYTLSFWYYNYLWNQSFNTVVIAEFDSLNNNLQWIYFSPLNTSTIHNWWYFIEQEFKVKSKNNFIQLITHGTSKFENWYAIDEVMIRPSNSLVTQVKRKNNNVAVFQNGLVVKPFD
jgi:hypothetical protein